MMMNDTQDPADSIHASEPATYPNEDAREVFRKIIMTGSTRAQIWASIVLAWDDAERAESMGRKAELALCRVLYTLRDSRTATLDVHCVLWLLNENSKSETDVAKLLGVTKQAISKRKRVYEDVLEMRSRVGRSDDAIETFSAIAKLRGKRSKKGTKWKPKSKL
jgi:hypothetical protein